MSWTKDSTGKLTVWTPDGIGNPNVIGDNVTPKPTFGFNSGTSAKSNASSKLSIFD